MFFMTVILILISCIYLLHRKIRRRSQNLPPMYPGIWPILGHSPLFINYGDVCHLSKLVEQCSQIVTKNGGIMTAYIGNSIYFVVTDPSDCTTLGNLCPDKDIIYDFGKPWFGNGLVTGSGEVWKHHRRSLNPAFNQQVLNSFIDIFNAQSEQLVNELENEVGKPPFNHLNILSITSLETVYQTVIGINSKNINIKNKNAYIHAVLEDAHNIMLSRFQTIWLHNEFIYKWSSLKKRQEFSVKIMKESFNEIMNAKKVAENNDDTKTENKFKAFVDLLLEYSADGSLSYEEVRDELTTILAAGYETSAISLAYTLILLGSHSAVQDKVYEELKEVFGNSFKNVDKIDLTKLVYLEAVIKEAIRIYPTVPVTIRRITEDIKLNNYTLPAGSSCILLIYGMHRHPVWGADADEFRPERWLEPLSPPRNAFAGFGLGKRNCIGKSFAITYTKTVLAHVLRRYRITADVTKMNMKFDFLLKPHSGCFISIDKRTT